MLQKPALTEDDAINVLVREFLCKHDLDHFVRDAEMQFSKVRYFSCSALGRMPEQLNTNPFEPLRVANSLIWLLASAKAVTPPAAQKVATTGLGPQVVPPIQQTGRR